VLRIKKTKKKQNNNLNNNNNNINFQNDFTNLQNMQNDPNLLMNPQYLLQFYLSNGYQPNNLAYLSQLSQMMNQNQNAQSQGMFGGAGAGMGDGGQIPGQDLNFLNNFAMLQMMNNGEFGNINAMMNNGENNNQDSQ
jgi:hypothetical protein